MGELAQQPLFRASAGRFAQAGAALAECEADSSAVVWGLRTIQSTSGNGARASYDGAKRRKGSTVHVVVDTLGQLLAAVVTPANEPDRGQVATPCEQGQSVTAQHV